VSHARSSFLQRTKAAYTEQRDFINDQRSALFMLDEAKRPDILSERLPFLVKIATTEDLKAVAQLRAAAYGKHLPALAAHLLQPEAADFELGNEVFVAVSKLDGSMLGSFRTHSNLLKPLPLEASVELPAYFRGLRLIEATRLSVLGSLQASLVRNALFKTFFKYCLSQKAAWMLAAGRRPVDRLYDSMLWRDVDGVGKLYPMAHAAGVPHRVMCMAPAEAEPIWRAAGHPLFRFAFQTEHPDLDLSGIRPLDATLPVIDTSRGIANALAQALGEPPPSPTVPRVPQCNVTDAHASTDSALADKSTVG